MAVDTWTVAKTIVLKDLWAKGLSASEVAKHVGVSRSAVLGKLWRLGAAPPAGKKPIVIRRVYTRQPIEVTKANARERVKRYRLKVKLERPFEAGQEARERLLERGASTTSAVYRRHLPQIPVDMTKGQLRAMLAQAVQNTAAL